MSAKRRSLALVSLGGVLLILGILLARHAADSNRRTSGESNALSDTAPPTNGAGLRQVSVGTEAQGSSEAMNTNLEFVELMKYFLPAPAYEDLRSHLGPNTRLPHNYSSFAMAMAPVAEMLDRSHEAKAYAAALQRSLTSSAADVEKLRMLALLYSSSEARDPKREKDVLTAYTAYTREQAALVRLATLEAACGDRDAAYQTILLAVKSDPASAIGPFADGVLVMRNERKKPPSTTTTFCAATPSSSIL